MRSWTLLLAAALLAALAQAQREATLATGTRYETTWQRIDSGRDGPTVLLTGGIHGDEPAGARAARQIAGWTIERGTLVVVPRANVPALDADSRRIPDLPREQNDLNRQFPKQKGDEPTGELAAALWQLVLDVEPDLVVDLHEGSGFTQIDKGTVGSSVIASKDARRRAQRMLDALNPSIEDAQKKFVLKGPPVAGSLARAAHEVLGVPSMIVETTRRTQALAFRVRQHRILVHRLLADLRMVAHGPDVLVGTAADEDDVRIGMYVASGVGGSGPQRLESILTQEHDFVLRRLCAGDVFPALLAQFDVIVFPGGSGSGQGRAIGLAGREAVREFVRRGGGYVGICAGAYLAANNYDWSLKILDADVIDREHWARGRGMVAFEWTDEIANGTSRGEVRYANGPLYAPSNDPDIPDFVSLALFRGEIRKNEEIPEGVMRDSPAVVTGSFGQGRVVCSSPHPELTDGLEDAVRALVRRAAGRN